MAERKKNPGHRSNKPRETKDASPREETPALSEEQKELTEWFRTVRFRKAVFGGVDEDDLWKKLEGLNRLYEAAIVAERARYNALMAAYVQNTNAKAQQYQQSLSKYQDEYRKLAQAYNNLIAKNQSEGE